MQLENLSLFKPPEEKENDFRDEEGYLVCGKCNTRKEFKVTGFGNTPFMAKCLCKCEELEIQKQEELERKRQENFKFQKRQTFISPNYRNIYLNNSDIELTKAKNYIENFAKFRKHNIGLMIYGKVGNGKTFVASVIANELCKKGYTVMMIHTTQALNKISNFDNEDFIKELIDVDLLIIDDFGVSRNTDYQLEQLNNLIDIRYGSKKPLIITTNITREHLQKVNDVRLERTYDRLIEMTHPLLLDTPQRRKRISQSRYQAVEKVLKKGKDKE